MTQVSLHWRLRSALGRRSLLDAGLRVATGVAVPSAFELWATFLGARPGDYRRAVRSARSLAGWTRAFQGLARGEEVRGERALARGAVQTAADAFALAPVYWHLAHFGVRTEPGSKQSFVQQGAHAYRRGLPFFDPPVEAVSIPYEGVELPGYLHLPEAAPDAPVPLVAVPNALNHAKETLHGVARRLARRGVAAVAFDGPGAGESWDRLPFRGWEGGLGPAVAAWARQRGDVDAERLGACAVSLGATVAAQMATEEPAFRAVALFSPAYDATPYWDVLSPVLKEEIRYTSGTGEVEDERAMVERASLAGHANRARAAAFVVDGTDDWVVPPGEGRRLARSWGGPVELREVEGANHGGLERIHALADEAADWLAEHLLTAPTVIEAREPLGSL